MPLVTDDIIKPFEGGAAAPYEKPTLFDQLGASLTRENTIGAAFTSRGALPSERTGRGDYDFQLEQVLTDQEKAFRGAFVGARSTEDVAEIRKRIEDERKSMRTLADGPLPEWLSNVAAGAFDPIQYLPAIGPLTKGASAAKAIGTSVVISTGSSEFALSNRQYERSTSESVGNVIMSAALGTGIGFIAGRLNAATTHAVATPAKGAVQDLGAIIRTTGLTGAVRPTGDLLSTTAVARFLDRVPDVDFRVNGNAAPSGDLLNALEPGVINRVNTATDKLAQLRALNDLVTVRGELGLPSMHEQLTTARHTLSDLGRFKQLNKELETYVDPKEVALRTAERDAILQKYPAFASNLSGTEGALHRSIGEMEQRMLQHTPEAYAKRQAEIMGTLAEQTNALNDMQRKMNALRDNLDSLGEKMGPAGKAATAADILRIREEVAAHLDKNFPLDKFKKPNANDWLKGIASNPALSETLKPAEGFVPLPKGDVEGKSLSAATVHGLDKRMSQLAASYKVAEVMAKLKKIGLAAPSLELGTSIFDAARQAVLKIVDTGMVTIGNMHGIANPENMHTQIKLTAEADIYAIDKIVEAGWKDYKRAAAGDAKPMAKKEFMTAVAYAMRRGDKHADEFVQDLAKELRKFDDKYKELAKEYKVGVFKEGDKGVGKTAESHFYRAYDTAVLRARYAEFIEMTSEYFAKRGIEDAKMKFEDGRLVDKAGKPVDIADDPRAYATEAAQSVYHKIMSFPDGRLPSEIKVGEGRGAARERTFNIPDKFVSEKGTRFEDFLDNNPINVMSRYVKTLGADVAYQKTIGGDEGLKDILDGLEREAMDLAGAAKAPKDSNRILKQYEHEAELIQRLIEQVRGTSSKPSDARYDGFNRVLKSARAFNVIRSLGSVIFSQLPDVGTTIMSEGMGRVFGTVIADAVHGFSGIKLGIAEGRRLGTATDMSLMGRSGALMDLGERYRNVSKAETMLDTAAHFSMIGFGIAPWTTAIKGVASHLGGDSILRGVIALAEGGTISDKLRATLARDGIGREEALRIFAEKDNFVKHNGLWISNAQSWKDPAAQNLFASALVRRVDNSVITPNAGDAPLWTSTEIGKTIFQFKRFAWASNQRTLIAGAQFADIESMNGVLAMMGLALLGTVGRDYSAKGEIDKKRTTAGWAREMVDRSGVVSQFMEGDALLDKATGGHGLMRTLTGEQAQRFASTGLIERAGGPTVGLLADTSKALSGVADGSLSGSDIHNLTRLLPARNFPATRYMFDQMEQNIVNHYGLPPRQTH